MPHDTEFQSWPEWEKISSHIQAIRGYNIDTESGLLKRAWILCNAAAYDLVQGRYEFSSEKGTEASIIQIKLLGENHEMSLLTLSNLANSTSHMGKYKEAKALHQRVFEARKQILGPKHPSTLTSMNNLGTVLSHLGQQRDAEEIYRHVLGVQRELLGEEHPDSLSSLSSLANCLVRLGKYREAEQMHREEWELSKKILGERHTHESKKCRCCLGAPRRV